MKRSSRESVPSKTFANLPPVCYPNEYVWLVFISTMDIIMTWIILEKYEGSEANPIAQHFLDRFGGPGLIAFKFLIVCFVVLICEIVGRSSKKHLGRFLARLAVVVSAIPLFVSLYVVLLRLFGYKFGGP